MSNTSDVTPYDSAGSSGSGSSSDYSPKSSGSGSSTGAGTSGSGSSSGMGILGLAAACAAGAAVGAIAVAQWLSQETEADKEAMERLKSQRRRETMDSWKTLKPQTLQTAHLHLCHPETLMNTAKRLGYRVERLALASGSTADQPILLRGPQGERVAIERNTRGRLMVHTAGNPSPIHTLLRQHSVDRALQHLASQGMQVQTATLSNGEVQILARESAPRRGGAAEIKAQIRTDGSAWIDVDKILGNRCEELVQGFAQAIGGEVTGMKKKDACFQLPGEPTRPVVRV